MTSSVIYYSTHARKNVIYLLNISSILYIFVILKGLAQCTELCSQLRGECGKRQVPGASIALQHNLGLGGAVVVAFYKLGFPQSSARTRLEK